MKRITYILPLSLILMTIISCGRVLDNLNELTQFTITPSDEFVIPSTPGVTSTVSFPTPDIEIKLEEEFDNNNSNKELIESALLKKMVLNLKSPDTGNFDFLNEINLYIETEREEKIVLASATDIPEDKLTSIPLKVTNKELREYLNKDTFSITGEMVIDKTIETEYTIEITTEFYIDAEILGI